MSAQASLVVRSGKPVSVRQSRFGTGPWHRQKMRRLAGGIVRPGDLVIVRRSPTAHHPLVRVLLRTASAAAAAMVQPLRTEDPKDAEDAEVKVRPLSAPRSADVRSQRRRAPRRTS